MNFAFFVCIVKNKLLGDKKKQTKYVALVCLLYVIDVKIFCSKIYNYYVLKYKIKRLHVALLCNMSISKYVNTIISTTGHKIFIV